MMADYYAMAGQKSEALDCLHRALQLEPKNTEVLFRAALVYNHFGQTNEALQWLQKAIDAGYSRSEVKDFPDFDSLQSDSQFKALLATK